MSLELLIEANTKALEANTAALLGAKTAKPAAAPKETKVEKPAAEKPPKPESKVSLYTIKQVTDEVVKVAKEVSREAAVAILTKFGVARGSELKPEQFDAVMVEAKGALAEAKALAEAFAASAEEDSLV